MAGRMFEGCVWLLGVSRGLFVWYYKWRCILKLLNDTPAAINTWVLGNRVAWIEEHYIVQYARHTAGSRCIHAHSRCQRLHQVFGSPWARSAIWWAWKNRNGEESKTSQRWQCYNPEGVNHETMFSKDNWDKYIFREILEVLKLTFI